MDGFRFSSNGNAVGCYIGLGADWPASSGSHWTYSMYPTSINFTYVHTKVKIAKLTKNHLRVGGNLNEITRGAPCKVVKLTKMANVTKM